jgi:hypothetical protein
MIVSLVVLTCLSGCAQRQPVSEHYVSPEIEGASQKINLDEVQKAFWDTKGQSDFKAWMAAFEKRVNEIYDGEGIVSLDATRENNRLVVTGYIDDKKTAGFQPGDEKLFSIEQTGEVVNDKLPYRVVGQDGRPYYEGHRNILDNPFVQMMVVSHLMGSWGGRYYTPYSRHGDLYASQSTWRQSPQFGQQKAANQEFHSRFKAKASGSGFQSKSKFGAGGFSAVSTSQRRSWDSSGSSGNSGFSWGSRRSSGSSLFGGSRRWGGRRR